MKKAFMIGLALVAVAVAWVWAKKRKEYNKASIYINDIDWNIGTAKVEAKYQDHYFNQLVAPNDEFSEGGNGVEILITNTTTGQSGVRTIKASITENKKVIAQKTLNFDTKSYS